MTTSSEEYALTDMSDEEVDERLDMLAENFNCVGRGYTDEVEDVGEDGTI